MTKIIHESTTVPFAYQPLWSMVKCYQCLNPALGYPKTISMIAMTQLQPQLLQLGKYSHLGSIPIVVNKIPPNFVF
jgi:hypothetical protein